MQLNVFSFGTKPKNVPNLTSEKLKMKGGGRSWAKKYVELSGIRSRRVISKDLVYTAFLASVGDYIISGLGNIFLICNFRDIQPNSSFCA